MKQQIHEQFSMLMDGELGRDEMRFLLRRIENSAELSARWARYHVIRQVLRRQDVALAPGFATAVMARLEHEPAVRTGRAAQWLHWGASGAIAASVAVAALMLTRPIAVDTAPPQRTAAARADQTSAAPVVVATATPAPRSEFHAPLLLAPDPSAAVAPVSFGTGLIEPAATEPRTQQPYLARPNNRAAGGGIGPSYFVPHILLGNQRQDAPPAAAQSH